MARGVNKVILVGNVGADPETRYTPSGTAISSVRMATSESWKDKQTGEQQERTEWHRVEFFGRLAEVVGEYVKKGSQIYVEGKLRTDEYEKDGVKRYSTKVIGDEMQMLGSRPGTQSGSDAPRGNAPARPQSRSAPAQDNRAPAHPVPAGDGFDSDEIPF